MITITNSGIYKSEFSIPEMKHPEDLELIQDDEVIQYLSENVELGESVTFERIFNIIYDNVGDLNKIFYSCLGGFSIAPFMNELEEIPTNSPEVDKLEIHWFGDKQEDNVSIVSGLHGVGVDDGKVCYYGVEFTSLNNLKYLKLKLNTELSLINYDDPDNYKFDIGNRHFTLYDLFYGILYEISWNGDPSNRDLRLEELDISIKRSKEEIESVSESEAHEIENLDEFFAELDANDKYLVKYKELRDRVDEDLSEGVNLIPLKSCLLEKLKIYDKIENSDVDITKVSKMLTDIEFNMQLLYELNEDEKYHRFWETPKCTCPKIDNVVKYPKGDYIKDKKCPIHGKL
jgi:hypothetical protein